MNSVNVKKEMFSFLKQERSCYWCWFGGCRDSANIRYYISIYDFDRVGCTGYTRELHGFSSGSIIIKVETHKRYLEEENQSNSIVIVLILLLILFR
jgi:hypothetical protein